MAAEQFAVLAAHKSRGVSKDEPNARERLHVHSRVLRTRQRGKMSVAGWRSNKSRCRNHKIGSRPTPDHSDVQVMLGQSPAESAGIFLFRVA